MNTNANNKTFLVLGGTGFIGSNLVRYLLNNNHSVILYHRENSNLKNLEGLDYTYMLGDLADKNNIEKTLSQAMDGCDAVFNLAVCDTPLKKYFPLMKTINIEAVKIIARLAGEVKGLRLIHVSSSTAIGYPEMGEILDENFKFNAHNDPYALSKHIGEETVLKAAEQGLDAVVAIPCSTIGPQGMKAHQFNMLKSIAQGKMRIYPAGGLCLTNVEDLVEGLYLCYKKGMTGGKYILGGHNITYKEYFVEIARATGGKAPGIRLPKFIMPWLGSGVEQLYGLLKKDTNINKHVAKMISNNLYYSSASAIKELGYSISDWKKTIQDTVHRLQLSNRMS